MGFDAESIANQKILNVEINDEMRRSFLDYSMSVITARALPDVRDGLKPVHRRILYTMYDNSLFPDKPYRKCADTVGSVLGRFHPHGDASVYDAMVRLAQPFSMRYILVDGHGNFGSIDGDPPAAYRYTESRMSKIALEMLTDIDKDTVDFVSNYDDRLEEPTVLPARIPQLLVNGSTGIAVGMATNIPPHNLREVVDGMCALIDDPDIELGELMEHIQGPDFPTAGIIMGRSGIRAAYATGRGKITVRAKCEIKEDKPGRFSINVTEIPYMVNKARLIESIADLVKDKRIEGISDINDYSAIEGMHIVIELKRDANPQVVLNQLYNLTQLQTSFGVINLALVDGVPKVLTLKGMLEEYIRHQENVITRRTRFNLRKAQERAHILEALLVALDFIDEVIDILRSSPDQATGKQRLIDRFGFDEIQAQKIVEMRLGQLTGMERRKISDEMDALKLKIAEYTEILADESKVMQIIKDESRAIADKYGDDRRTEICNVSGEVDIEDLIPKEECVYTLTTRGYLKRMPADTYRSQRRGGKGIMGMTRREEDVVQTMFTCSSHDHIMFFTNRGKAYKIKGYEIPEATRTGKGINAVNVLPIDPDEKISVMLRVPAQADGEYLCMVTRGGTIKRTELDAYKNIRKNGIIAISLDEGDELAWVRLTNGSEELVIGTSSGYAIRFNETDVRSMGRTARGVRAISLREGDSVVGMELLDETKTLLTVSETGYGRRSPFSDYRLQSRGGKGIINYKTEKYGNVAALLAVHEDDDVIMISADGIIIRTSADSVSVISRTGKGVRVMRTGESDRLISVTSTAKEPDEPAEEEETDGEGAPESTAEAGDEAPAESETT